MAAVVPFIPMALNVVSTIAGGAQKAGKYDDLRRQAEENASITRRQYDAAEETQRRRMAVELGNQRAAAAESGFTMGGSMGVLLAKNAGEMELDVLTQRYEGMLKALSFDREAAKYEASAKSARRGALFSSASSLLTGGLKMFYGRK